MLLLFCVSSSIFVDQVMLSQNPGCNRFHSSFDVFVGATADFSDAADEVDRVANATTTRKRIEDATLLVVNFLEKLVVAFSRFSENNNSGDEDDDVIVRRI